MGCNCKCNNNHCEIKSDCCKKCNDYCDLCYSINSPITEYFSEKYHNLENNYPVKKCQCNPFGINPKYYSPIHVPCNCKNKCYPC